jgi:hypothetical protein
MRKFNKKSITDQMLYNVLVDHKNRSYKQISGILEEIEFRKLSLDESLKEEINKNIKNCPSCLIEMKDSTTTEKSHREIKYHFYICSNCYSDIQKIDKKLKIKKIEGHELYDLLDSFKIFFKDDESFFFGKT